MARLEYALLAEYARVDAGGLLTIVGAGFDRVVVPALPSQLQVACAVHLTLPEDEKDARVSIAIRLPAGPSLSIDQLVQAPLEAKPHRGRVGVSFAASMGLPIVASGTYVFTVTINGEDEQEMSFDVDEQAVGQADV